MTFFFVLKSCCYSLFNLKPPLLLSMYLCRLLKMWKVLIVLRISIWFILFKEQRTRFANLFRVILCYCSLVLVKYYSLEQLLQVQPDSATTCKINNPRHKDVQLQVLLVKAGCISLLYFFQSYLLVRNITKVNSLLYIVL